MVDGVVEMSVGMVVEVEFELVVEVFSVDVFSVEELPVEELPVEELEIPPVVLFSSFSVVSTPEEVCPPKVVVFTFSELELDPVVVRTGVELISESVVDAAVVIPAVVVSVDFVVSMICVVVEITTPVVVELRWSRLIQSLVFLLL